MVEELLQGPDQTTLPTQQDSQTTSLEGGRERERCKNKEIEREKRMDEAREKEMDSWREKKREKDGGREGKG